jgi:hypothetical protein
MVTACCGFIYLVYKAACIYLYTGLGYASIIAGKVPYSPHSHSIEMEMLIANIFNTEYRSCQNRKAERGKKEWLEWQPAVQLSSLNSMSHKEDGTMILKRCLRWTRRPVQNVNKKEMLETISWPLDKMLLGCLWRITIKSVANLVWGKDWSSE